MKGRQFIGADIASGVAGASSRLDLQGGAMPVSIPVIVRLGVRSTE